MYAILTITCINNPNILIHVFLLTNILYIVYIGLASPNDTVMSRRMEIFNESGLQLITYHLAVFPLALTTDGEFDIGWSMIGTVGFVFAGNLLVMVAVTIIGLKRKLYLRKLKKQHEKAMEAIKLKALQNEAMQRVLGIPGNGDDKGD